MAKPRKIATPPARTSERRRLVGRIAWRSALLAVVCVAAAVGYRHLEKWVATRVVFPDQPPLVVLKNRPAWMSDLLADQIAASARPPVSRSALDAQLLRDAHARLATNPWIKNVRQVRRAFGRAAGDTLEIDCDYRAPIALVAYKDHGQDFYRLVDGDGFVLPEQYTPQQVPRIVFGHDRRMNIRIIDGVKNAPPRQAGVKWPGEDLAAGLELVQLLAGREYAEQILKVDVSNFAGRRDGREAHLVLVTQFATEIRWGRPASSKDAFIEVSAAQKLDYLRRLVEEFKRVDARHPWVDIRFDQVTYPAPNTATARVDR